MNHKKKHAIISILSLMYFSSCGETTEKLGEVSSRTCPDDSACTQDGGPFPPTLVEYCLKAGGEESCHLSRWKKSFYRELTYWCVSEQKASCFNAHSPSDIPAPLLCTEEFSQNSLCTQNGDGFPNKMVETCHELLQNDPACNTNRWSKEVYFWTLETCQKNWGNACIGPQSPKVDIWQEFPSEYSSDIKKIKNIPNDLSYFSIDIRVILNNNTKYILWQNNQNIGYIPASVNKIPSALSAFLNKSVSWDSMSTWLKPSNNTLAEDAWNKGGKTQGVQKAYEMLGLNIPSSFKNVDGSGLSYSNKIPASFMTDTLYIISQKSWFKDFYTSLPQGGVSGTLASSFQENHPQDIKIFAKTGTLNEYKGVKALAGYALHPQGHKLIFTLFYNGNANTASTGKAQIEKIVSQSSYLLKKLNP